MAEYKKRRVERLKRPPRPKKKIRTAQPPRDIPMAESFRKAKKQEKDAQKMRVLKGNKAERKRRARFFTALTAVIAAGILAAELILPCGILENLGNVFALIGSGGYPIELDSSDTIHVESGGGYYYLLSNADLAAYSGAGKKIFGVAHGFEMPVLKTSATRAMLFSERGQEIFIYTLSGREVTLKTEEEIITGNLSDSGVFAVVTRSSGYASTVRVYDKRGKLLYEWNSALDVINSVALSPNGKKIAVASFQASGGVYQTKIRILNYQSATPEFEKAATGDLIRELHAFQKGFFAVGKNEINFYEWKNGSVTEYKNDYDLIGFKAGKREAAAVFTRASNKSDTRMVMFSRKGEKKAEFEYKGTVSDIQVSGGHIYCIGDNQVSLLDETGTVIRQASCGFAAGKVVPAGSNYAVVFSDNEIQKLKLEQRKGEKSE